jgi:hypothetical protein
METNWAAENIQVIRTLMERSSVYRRALAPVMILVGTVGTMAAAGGIALKLDTPRQFELYWVAISAAVLAAVYLLVRRQALKDAEPFWSPPTRRVTSALLPPFAGALAVSLIVFVHFTGAAEASVPEPLRRVVVMLWLPIGWIILYGCALHAAGFFMQRGIKLLGWGFVVGGCVLFAAGTPDIPRGFYAHGIMGLFFGLLHLAYGVYLYFTEAQKKVA